MPKGNEKQHQVALPLEDRPNQSTIRLDEDLEAASGADEDETVEGELVDEETTTAPVAITPAEATGMAGVESLAVLATDEQIERAIKRVVARVKATKQYKAALLSMTNVRDWYAHAAEGDEDGTPYLAESGSEKVVHAFEIEVEHDGGERQRVDEGGYEFVYNGKMRALAFSDRWYSVVGSRWSEDGFFTRGGNRTADPGDVRKAAWTNFMNRGIKTVCGLKTITWDELESIPGMEDLRNRCTKIGYKSGGGAPPAPGELSELEKGKHIKVRIDKEDMDSRNALKKLPAKDRTWNKNPGCFYWVLRYTEDNFKRCADLKAANNAVQFKAFNVPESELPI